jgi:tetratricopeptide (TPR) repeat protein
VSRRRPLLVTLAMLIVWGGCASTSAPRTEEAKDLKPLQARAAYERGVAHMRDGQPGAALTALQEALSLDPTVAVYANTFGVILLQLRQLDAALAWLQRAVQLDPNYGDAQLNYAIALAEAGHWEAAVASYRKALVIPTLTTPHLAHQNLGVALYNLKRYAEAEQALRFALTLDPQMVGVHYNLGLVLLAAGRTPEAIAAFRREREVAPADSSFSQAATERLKALGAGG